MARDEGKAQKRNLVGDTAERLRDMVFGQEPGARIGSLQDLARTLGVGIVTLQQAARVLEHEGLLEARRGPGGGYYGARPGAEALERALSAWLRMHPASFEEALDITSLLFIELCAAAAECDDAGLRGELRALSGDIDSCDALPRRGAFEEALQNLLFRMVDRPLFELLTHVTLAFAQTRSAPLLDSDPRATAEWQAGRHRIIDAILRQDRELARFEAARSNRRLVMAGLEGRRASA